ncbi:MAG: pyridoxal-phosphate dependent enzyme [Thermoanaerobaculia bacterium]
MDNQNTTVAEEGLFDLLDGAQGQSLRLSQSAPAQRIAADPNESLQNRLEAFEDIFESEVGDTALTRGRHLERETGLRQLFLKFEGANPSGTQKDRIAFSQVMDALRRGFDTVTVATCGNFGAAIAAAAKVAGMKAVVIIPAEYRTRRIAEIEAAGAVIRRVSGDYERAVEVSQRLAHQKDFYDANPGGANTAMQLQAYGQIAYEIYDELRDAPAVVAVPVSNGTTLAGIHRGFMSLYRRGKTSRIPRMVAASSHGKNPIVQSYRKNLLHCEPLNPEKIRETATNEPLINWRALDGDHALESIRQSDGWATYVSDRAMLATARKLLERESLNVLPAATAGLIAVLDQHATSPFPGDRYVAVITGRKG